MNTTYYISKDEEIIFQTEKFDKTQLKEKFDETAKTLSPGQEVSYWKEDKKHIHPYMLWVININGKLKVVTKHGRLKPYTI